jgi:hypothetical protein
VLRPVWTCGRREKRLTPVVNLNPDGPAGSLVIIPISRFQFHLLTPYLFHGAEKRKGFQLVKKFPAFYGTRRFITASTSARHLSLS